MVAMKKSLIFPFSFENGQDQIPENIKFSFSNIMLAMKRHKQKT